jgi:hypothetical protein
MKPLLCALACASFTSVSALGAVLFDTLGQPEAGIGLSYGFGGFASDFRTGAEPTTIRGLIVNITNIDETTDANNNPLPGREHILEASLYSSSDGLPGALVKAFDAYGVSRPRTSETYFNDAGISLAPNTVYWVGIRAVTTPTWEVGGLVQGSTATDAFEGNGSLSPVTDTALAVQFTAPGWAQLGGWLGPYSTGNLRFSLSDTAVPEPAAPAGLLLGLAGAALRRRRRGTGTSGGDSNTINRSGTPTKRRCSVGVLSPPLLAGAPAHDPRV